ARRARHSVLCGDAGEGTGRPGSSTVIKKSMGHPYHLSQRRRDVIVAAACGAFAAAMVGAAYAAVPLYNWFCRTTGFAGTPQVASAAPGQVLDRKITVRFDANVLGGLPWRFAPEQSSVEVKVGEVVSVNYTVVNEAA